MNGAVPSNGNIKIGCGAEDVELEFREMTVHTDGRHGGGRIDLFTDAKRSKAKGPIHMSSTGAVDPRSISEHHSLADGWMKLQYLAFIDHGYTVSS